VAAVVAVPGDRGVYYIGAGGGRRVEDDRRRRLVERCSRINDVVDGAVALALQPERRVGGHGGREPAVTTWWMAAGSHVARCRQELAVHGPRRRRPGLSDRDRSANPTSSSWRQGHVWAPNAERGVFRTADGGKTWEKVLFVNDSTARGPRNGAGNPRMLFAGMWQFVARPWELVSGGAGVVSIGPRTAA